VPVEKLTSIKIQLMPSCITCNTALNPVVMTISDRLVTGMLQKKIKPFNGTLY